MQLLLFATLAFGEEPCAEVPRPALKADLADIPLFESRQRAAELVIEGQAMLLEHERECARIRAASLGQALDAALAEKAIEKGEPIRADLASRTIEAGDAAVLPAAAFAPYGIVGGVYGAADMAHLRNQAFLAGQYGATVLAPAAPVEPPKPTAPKRPTAEDLARLQAMREAGGH